MKKIFLAIAAVVLWSPMASAQTTEALLDTVQKASFQFFWNETNVSNGLMRDRSQPGSPCSIASQGFGLSAICVAIDRGWIDRASGRARVLTTLQTYWNGPQGFGENGFIGYKGFFYHFLDMNTAVRTWSSELSSIDTALLLAGVLDAKRYFDRSDAQEVQIRELADSLYRRVDWNWMRNFFPGIMMQWKPTGGFSPNAQWIGYNEAMILYLLALGSPTHPVPTTAWTAWTSGYDWETHEGQTYIRFEPLFGHQYSHCWVDFRLGQDAYMRGKGITYFENSRRATLAQQAYCIANPGGFVGYGDSLWGLTAGDGPSGYNARGAPPAFNDDGTLSPTAPASSIPFAPEICIPAVRNMYNAYHGPLWGPYGFKDAFNPTLNWYDGDYLGIDQGPIVLMIENYRTGTVWNRFMRNPEILLGLQRAGFLPVTGVDDAREAAALELEGVEPNPFVDGAEVRFRMARPGRVRLSLHDVAGRVVATPVDGTLEAGPHAVPVAGRALPAGVYYVRLEGGGLTLVRKCVLLR